MTTVNAHIVVVSSYVKVWKVGASRISDLCLDLERLGHTLSIFTDAKLSFRKPYHNILSPRLQLYRFPVIHIPRLFFNPLTVILMTVLGWNVLRKHRPDIILASVPEGEPGIVAYILSKLFKVPLIIDVRDIWLEPMYIYRPIVPTTIGKVYKRVFSAIYRACSHVTFVTERTKEYYVREYKVSPQKTSIVPNGARVSLAKMDFSKYEVRKSLGLPVEKTIVSYVGVLASYYQFSLIFEALCRLRKKFTNLLFIIVGDGSQKSFCQEMIENLRLGNAVMLHGWVRREIAHKFIMSSDIGFVPLADRMDEEIAVPAKVYEYMALGVPTVVTGKNNWEISRFFENTKAGLVVAHNSHDVSDGLAQLINEKDLLEILSKNGRRAILEQYSREKAALKMYAIIDKTLKEKAQEISP